MPIAATCKMTLIALLTIPVAARAQQPMAGSTPPDAVMQFMHAIRDSNLTRVGELFGTANGPVSRTHEPKDYEKRILTMQLFLRRIEAKTLGDVPSEKGNGRTVTTQLSHSGCLVTIPVDVVKVREGWIVKNFDLDRASQVNRPCPANSGGRGGGNPN